MTKRVLLLACVLLLGGCADQVKDFAREPYLTPVGAGLTPNRVGTLTEPPPGPAAAPPRPGNSFWQDTSIDLFRDPRAMRVGDVVTVKISIRDKASLDNTSERSRDSKRNLNFDGGYELNYPFLKGKGDGKIDANVNSGTSTKGQGAITRSESIELLVAAVVADVLPNGNLVISGSQEVRVNFELRVLSVAGVVRPRDIATDNTISYDKIAEARISYGGRGRIMEVQQPGWGHQLVDLLSPF
jgi:flagellar L-ring protein FlgH